MSLWQLLFHTRPLSSYLLSEDSYNTDPDFLMALSDVMFWSHDYMIPANLYCTCLQKEF